MDAALERQWTVPTVRIDERPLSLDQHSRIWQTIAQHEPLAKTLPRIHRILRETAALGGLRIDRLDADLARLDTVAASEAMPWVATPIEPTRVRALDTSFQRHARYVVPAGTPEGTLSVFGSPTKGQQRLIVKLPTAGAGGFAILDLATDWRESDIDGFVAALLPLARGLDNQRRLAELDRLRVDADTEGLSRMQRQRRPARCDHLIGEDRGLEETMRQANAVAGSDTTVLLLGATGTGKEVIARTIHDRSPRASAPFVRVNCGAIPPDLIDSELFGHEKGSFTGAIQRRRGWFERADGGTLFLDEIGELPMPAQVRLLRVLQEHTFHRVGGEQETLSNTRVIAATHRDLDAMVTRGEFRADLWYRIAIFPIRIPSLAERADDIPDLAAYIARRVAHRLGLPAVVPGHDDLVLLRGYDWPGNVREMMAVIERAAILGEGQGLALARALENGGGPSAVRHTIDPKATTAQTGWPTLEDALQQHLVAALRHCQGRINGPQGAAQLLDISPNTLRNRLRRHGLAANDYR